jgi:hypothetical protein
MSSSTLPRHARTGALALGWRKARRGEDPARLHPIWPIAGGAPDDEGDSDSDDGQGDDDDGDPDGDDGQGDGTGDGIRDDDQGDDAGSGQGDRPLGPKGEQALARMKAKLKTERERRKAAEDRLQSGTKKDDEPDAEEVRRQAEQAATAKANQRLLKAEVRAAAKGKLADPKDAFLHLDLDQFEVGEDGEIDADDIEDAIDDLIKNKPYLAAQGGRRFQGSADGGAARKASRPKQLTRQDLKTMTPEQITKAQDDGRFDDLLGAT